jgi:hypothetical protein
MNTRFFYELSIAVKNSYCLLLVGAFVLSACGKSGSSPDVVKRVDSAQQNISEPGWVFERKEPKPIAIVFIHGIFGDALGTWTNPNGMTFFDLAKQADGIGDKVDIYAFGYTSKMLAAGSLSIDGASNKLDHVLEDAGIWKYEQVVFVAHSMGGLVLMHELTMNPDRSRNIPLMIFYASPQEGSQITDIADHIVTNDAIRQMLPVDRNHFLRDLSNRWVNFKRSGQAPTVVCGYETKKTGGVMIVPYSSSSRFCDEVASPIEDTDHLTIVKPATHSGMAVVIFRNAMRKYVLPTIDADVWKVSKIDTSQNDWAFNLQDVNNFNSFDVANQSDIRQWLQIQSVDDDLYIPSDYRRRTVAARDKASVGMFVLGNLKPKYQFKIRLGSTPERLVTVHIPNLQEAFAMRAKRESERAENIASRIEELRVSGSFAQYSKQDQEVLLSKIAYEVTSEQFTSAPEQVRWMVAASTLAKVNPRSADFALKQINIGPQDGNSVFFRSLSAKIMADAVNYERQPTFIINPPSENDLSPTQLRIASNADIERWRALTDVMAKVPAMSDQSNRLRIMVDRANETPVLERKYLDGAEGAVANGGEGKPLKGV